METSAFAIVVGFPLNLTPLQMDSSFLPFLQSFDSNIAILQFVSNSLPKLLPPSIEDVSS